MTTAKRRNMLYNILVLALLLVAWLCRVQRSGNIRGWMRCGIQCILLFIWGVSIQKRIISDNVRKYILSIVALFAFWLLVRTVKYTLLSGSAALTRYAWYLYYIPQLLIPIFTLFSVLCVGKPESYSLPKKWYWLFLPAVAAIALVLTNDMHQLVFTFPNGIPNKGDTYSHEALYYFIMTMIFGGIIGFFAVLLGRCRLPGKGKLVVWPLIPIAILLIYSVFYVANYEAIAVIAGDMTAVNCLCTVACLEACIYTGLLPSNTHYEQFFSASAIQAQIADKDYRILLSSAHAPTLPISLMEQTARGPVMLDKSTRLLGKPIHGGHVLWTEDVSQLTALISDLEDLDEDLVDRHMVLQEEYETRHRRQSLTEKNRLYNQMQNETKEKILLLSQKIEALKQAQTQSETQGICAQIAVITAYLKRRNNLIFIAEENGTVPGQELSYCLRESVNNLRLFGASCEMQASLQQPLSFSAITAIYDAFETVAELTMDSLQELYVSVTEQDRTLTLGIDIVCSCDLTPLADKGFAVFQEDENEWTVEYRYTEGGSE